MKLLELMRQLIKREARRVYGFASFLRSFTHRQSSYVRQRWPGALDLDAASRVAVFAHFDRHGVVHDFVLHYLGEIARAGFTTVFVSNAPRLRPDSLERLAPLCGAILLRHNLGLDFGT